MSFLDSFADPKSDNSRFLSGLEQVTARFSEGFAKDPSVRTQQKIARLRREDADRATEDTRITRQLASLDKMGGFVTALVKDGNKIPPALMSAIKAAGKNIGPAGEDMAEQIALLGQITPQEEAFDPEDPFGKALQTRNALIAQGLPQDHPDVVGAQRQVDAVGGDDLNTIAKTVASLQESGATPDSIRAMLESQAQANPGLAEAIATLAEALPETSEDAARLRGEQDLAEAQPKIDALEAAGFNKNLATAMVLSSSGVNLPLQSDQLTPDERAGLRSEITNLGRVHQNLLNILPRINEDTIGIWGYIAENIGGIGQQIPGVKQIFNAIGGPFNLTEDQVTTAIAARNEFRFQVGQLKEFVTSKKTRLSNEDRQFVIDATGFLSTKQTAPAIRQTVSRLADIAAQLDDDARHLLSTGQIAPRQGAGATQASQGGGTFTIKRKEGGGFTVEGEDGQVLDTFTISP